MNLFLKKSWPFIVLAVLAFIIHFAFLSYPSQVVFDEVHFGKFVGAYFTGQYYFDIHPPLGKLMIAGFARLAGVNPVFDFEKIGEALPANTLFVLRFLPAFFGAIFVLIFSWLAFLISRSRTTALIAGFLILLDNAFLVQSKFILVDIFMLVFEVLTLCFFFLMQRQKSFSGNWFYYLFLTGIFFGLTISIKWTGLASFGVIAIVLFAKIFSKRLTDYLNPGGYLPMRPEKISNETFTAIEKKFARSLKVKEFLVAPPILLVLAATVYLIFFYVHFNLLSLSGQGDAFMSAKFQQELKFGRADTEEPLTFLQKFTELNKTMYTASANITASHPFGSRWYGWPLGVKPVYYWSNDELKNNLDSSADIYLSGNPILWWLTAASIIFVLLGLFLKKRWMEIGPIFYILLLAYFANLVPFILIKRVSFLYHYLPALTFGILLFSLLLSRFWSKEKKFLISVFFLIAIGFTLLTPLSYGMKTPKAISRLPLKIVSALTNF